MFSRSLRSATLAAAVTLTACVTIPSRSDSDKESGDLVDVTEVAATPSVPMVAKPMARKLLIVMNPAKVKNSMRVKNSPWRMKGIRSFLGAGLTKALESYFSEIEVVAPGYVEPTVPHVVVDVKLDVIETRNLEISNLTYMVMHMSWSIGVRPSESDEYLFSYAGTGESEPSYKSGEEGAGQMLTSALNGFIKGWTEKGVFEVLRNLKPPAKKAPGSKSV